MIHLYYFLVGALITAALFVVVTGVSWVVDRFLWVLIIFPLLFLAGFCYIIGALCMEIWFPR